jgi:hypothetical protein
MDMSGPQLPMAIDPRRPRFPERVKGRLAETVAGVSGYLNKRTRWLAAGASGSCQEPTFDCAA